MRITSAIFPVPAMMVASARPSLKCRQLSRPGSSVSNAWWPCLMVATRRPRRFSSAASATVSVVLPLFLRPTMQTAGGRSGALIQLSCDLLGAAEVVGSVHVEEHRLGVAEAGDLLRRQPCHGHGGEQ